MLHCSAQKLPTQDFTLDLESAINVDLLLLQSPRNMSRNGSSSSFLFPNKNISAEGEFLRSKESIGSGLFAHQQNPEQCYGLARHRTAPSSFIATLLESTTSDNNSSTSDDSEALFSAFMDNGHLDLNQMQCSMKQKIGEEMGYVGSYSVGMESTQAHKVNNNGSNLARQTSSPAGFFSGLGSMGGVGNYRIQNHAETNSSRGVSNQINFSSSSSSTSRFMPTIPENGNESISMSSSEDKRSAPSTRIIDPREYEPWNDSSFNGLKRTRDGELKMFSGFSGLENQCEESRKKSPGLVHHLSLPNTCTNTAEMQKFLHFQQDTVPCQIRAKRGFATHPRSIAERMRRTRISEKMKKLQDLFPNMDKQTNTSDMLDLAVEYIKDLQKQVKTLTDTRARCICTRGSGS